MNRYERGGGLMLGVGGQYEPTECKVGARNGEALRLGLGVAPYGGVWSHDFKR